MPVGIQVFGDSGAVQIDDNYANLSLAGKGALNPGNPSQDGGNVMTVSTAAANAIIFLRASGLVKLGAISDSGGTRTFTIQMATGVTSCAYWIFGKPPAPTSNFGLQIFDANGNCTFDATLKYMRVIGAVNTSSTPLGGAVGGNFGLPGVGPGGYAVAFADPGYIVEQLHASQGFQPTIYRMNATFGHLINGNTLKVSNFSTVAGITYPGGYNVTYSWRPPQSAIILDVTGL